MKKTFRISLLTAIVSCLAFVNARALDKVDSVYQIATANDLIEFAAIVNGGSPVSYCEITADLDFTGLTYTPIGTVDYPFRGTINGNFHRIKNLVINTTDNYQGIVGYIGAGATMKNIIMDSSSSVTGGDYVAAFAGGSSGSGTCYFQGLGNEANVTGGTNAAGIVGVSMDSSMKFEISDCYNTATITGNKECAIITGWAGSQGTTITNFYNVGTLASGIDGTNKLWRSSATTARTFDIEGVQGTQIDEERLSNGRVTFVFNRYKTDSVIWHQTLGEDPYPTLDPTHGTVYFAGTMNCNFTLPDDFADTGWTNENITQYAEHDYANGVCTFCQTVQKDYLTPVDSVYEIGTAGELYWFACYVNGLEGEKAYARLTADIDFSEYTEQDVVIGLGGHDFTGWFDGQGHTVNISYDTETQYTSLFRFVKAGTVRNLITTGDNVSSAKHNAGIAAYLVGTESKVENCVSYVNLASTIEGDATMGGIVAYTAGSGVYNCAFMGTMDGATSVGNSGIVGWGDNSPKIENCVVKADITINTAGDNDNNIIARNVTSSISNCYYFEDNGLKVPTNAKQFTSDQIGTGELAYLLNSMRSDTVYWYQNIDNEGDLDEFPVPFDTHGKVYAVGTLNCDGSPAGGEGYSNTNNSVTTPHNYVNGFCDFCHKIQNDWLTPVDGYYEIGTPEQLNWFAVYVNTLNNKVNGKLTADIDFTKYSADSVGIGVDGYYGTFDGQGHDVKVAYKTYLGTSVKSLFVTLQGGTIKNLSTSGTIQSYNITGGIVVSTRAGHIENCASTVALYCALEGDASIGGISGDLQGHSIVRNCAFYGTISTPFGNGCGGIACYANGGAAVVIENCVVVSKLLSSAGDNNCVFSRNNPTVVNSYYVDPGTYVLDHGTEVVDEQVKSGELCFLLNQNVSGGTPWTQAIGTDELPLPFGSAKVYAIGEIGCDGKTTTATGVTYSNTEGTLVKPEHAFDAENVCGNCGARKIETAEQLNALSEAINSGFANGDILVMLMNDIDMSDYPNYVGIGTEGCPFMGTFEGNGHVISHMNINTETQYQGLFGVVSAGAYIKDITVDSTCSVTVVNGGYAAGIAGSTTGTGLITFENCGNEATVTVSGANAAGIIGVNMGGSALLRLTNCYNAGAINGGKESAGISGWLGTGAELTNCYNIGYVTGLQGSNTCVRFSEAPTVVNCYERYGTQTTQVTFEQIMNGELCYLLNDSVSGGENFYQTLGTDLHPVLYKSHAKVYEVNGVYTNDIVGIKKVDTAAKGDGVERIYTIDGVRISKLQKGVNIVRKADGTTKKVLVK